jgi:hypothetical protein
MLISHSFLFRMRNISDKNCRENQNTRFMFNIFYRKSCRLWDNVEKFGRAGQATWQYNTARALCMLDDCGYRHTLRICNTSCFFTAKMVTRTRLSVTLYVRWLSCCFPSATEIVCVGRYYCQPPLRFFFFCILVWQTQRCASEYRFLISDILCYFRRK